VQLFYFVFISAYLTLEMPPKNRGRLQNQTDWLVVYQLFPGCQELFSKYQKTISDFILLMILKMELAA